MSECNPEDNFDICEKRRAILEGDGHMLVIGGPGSGKTTIALLKARRYVLESLTAEQSVLFLSFSNAAIRRILESAGGILTPDIAKRVDIKTYHSFAWEALKSHGYLTSKKRRLSIVSAQDAAVREAGLKKDLWFAEQERMYIEDGLVTYDQFAPRAAEILNRSDAAKCCFNAAYPLILVDEFQDTDEAQWALIQALSSRSSVIALGEYGVKSAYSLFGPILRLCSNDKNSRSFKKSSSTQTGHKQIISGLASFLDPFVFNF